MGNNSTNSIVCGSNSVSGSLEIYVNNTSNYDGAVNGIKAMYIDANANVIVSGGATAAGTAYNHATNRGNFTREGAAQAIFNMGIGGSRHFYIYHSGTDSTISNVANGHMAFQTNETSRMTILAAGNVGIGDTSPSYKLEVAGTFYSSGSSIEYKQEVEPYTPPEGALMSLKPVQYKYKDAWKDFGKRYAGNSSRQLGFVAEDVAKILPELAVTKTEDGKEVVRNVDYEKLTVLLVSEVQKLRTELDEIKNN